MGAEYILIMIGLSVPAWTGAGWVASKVLNRFHERILRVEKRMDNTDANLNSMHHRLPIEYVLKVDFLREMQQMQDNFKQINNKLDKLIEKL